MTATQIVSSTSFALQGSLLVPDSGQRLVHPDPGLTVVVKAAEVVHSVCISPIGSDLNALEGRLGATVREVRPTQRACISIGAPRILLNEAPVARALSAAFPDGRAVVAHAIRINDTLEAYGALLELHGVSIKSFVGPVGIAFVGHVQVLRLDRQLLRVLQRSIGQMADSDRDSAVGQKPFNFAARAVQFLPPDEIYHLRLPARFDGRRGANAWGQIHTLPKTGAR